MAFALCAIVFVLLISLTQEHLNSMGIAQWARFSGKQGWPVFQHSPPDTVRKRLAGNVPRLCLKFKHINVRSGYLCCVYSIGGHEFLRRCIVR